MPVGPMSSSVGELRSRYSVVIVGSGYGGSVLAARLSQTCETPEGICLLERGLELLPGEYPDRVMDVPRHIQASAEAWRYGSKSALFDFRFGPDVNVLVGCGLGGGSLINAGVSLRAPDAAFSVGWPPGLDRVTLDPYYQRAEEALGAKPAPDTDRYRKFKALQRSGMAIGSRAQPAPINVTFSAVGSVSAEPGGIVQSPCTSCGDCVSGCNVGAKNTLLMNYLPLAHRNGVEMFTQTGVRAVQRGSGKFRGKWLVYVDRPWGRRRPSPSSAIVADTVILAAGTLGSTEILLRSQQLGLPLSRRVGAHFSANGDVLGFAFDGRTPVDAMAGAREVPATRWSAPASPGWSTSPGTRTGTPRGSCSKKARSLPSSRRSCRWRSPAPP